MNKWVEWINKNPFGAMAIMLATVSLWMQYKGTKKLASVFETHKTRRKNPLSRGESEYLKRRLKHHMEKEVEFMTPVANPKARRRK